jgi:hypothetical protein
VLQRTNGIWVLREDFENTRRHKTKCGPPNEGAGMDEWEKKEQDSREAIGMVNFDFNS